MSNMNEEIAIKICEQMIEDVESLCECPRFMEEKRTCVGCRELAIKTILQENKQLKEENNKKLDRLINLEEKILDYQGKLSLLKITIENFLCTEEYINVDGKAIANNYEKILEILNGGENNR